jgi:hypothetical protein
MFQIQQKRRKPKWAIIYSIATDIIGLDHAPPSVSVALDAFFENGATFAEG